MGATAHRLSKAEQRKREEARKRKVQRVNELTNGNRFTPLRHDLVNSPEFKQLSGSAVKAFCYIMGQFNGKNNGEIVAPKSLSLELMGLSKNSFVKSINELIRADFIEIIDLPTNNSPTYFGLTCFPIIGESRPKDTWKKTKKEGAND